MDDRSQAIELAQPETKGLTDEELLRTYGAAKRDHCYDGPIDDWPKRAERAATVYGLRAAIAADRARYGRPAVAPVAVADRQPSVEAGDLDNQGRCWWGDAGDEQFVPSWRLCEQPDDSHFTHWKPHWAIPVPTTTQESSQ